MLDCLGNTDKAKSLHMFNKDTNFFCSNRLDPRLVESSDVPDCNVVLFCQYLVIKTQTLPLSTLGKNNAMISQYFPYLQSSSFP